MQCPACHQPLSEIVVPPVTLDVCVAGCKGIWFDRGELEKILRNQTQALKLMDTTGWETHDQPVAPGRTCPRCREVRLKAFHWGQQYPVEIDLCPQCGGFWLDAGELLLVSEGLKAGEKLPQVKPVARPGVAHVPGAPLSPGEVLAWEVVDDLAEVAIWFGPELIQAGALAAEALPEAATAVIQAPFAIVEALPAAAEGVGLAAAGVAEGMGAAAENATEILPALGEMIGALIGGIFEFLGGLE